MTKFENIRIENINIILSNTKDDGRFGRAFELQCSRQKSRKTTVAKQGKNDNAVKFAANNKRGYKYIPVECKINGGRVETLIDGSNKSKYVVYKLDFTKRYPTKNGKVEKRITAPAIIVPTEVFVQALLFFGATHKVGHKNDDGVLIYDGISIQKNNNLWIEWVQNWPVKFDNERVYKEEDFKQKDL